jgi:hypothetical protein
VSRKCTVGKKYVYDVLVCDPNFNHAQYRPLAPPMIDVLESVFQTQSRHYIHTCQTTVLDTFCQMWSLWLMCNPDFVPESEDPLRVIYHIIRRAMRERKSFVWFLGELAILDDLDREQIVSRLSSMTYLQFQQCLE